MKRAIALIMFFWEFVVVYGITGLFAFVKMNALALGSILTFLGVFMPSKFVDRLTGGGEVAFKDIRVAVSGSLRMGVVACGIVISILSFFSGVNDLKNDVSEKTEKSTEDLIANLSSDDSRTFVYDHCLKKHPGDFEFCDSMLKEW
jgi:hypothetical protein